MNRDRIHAAMLAIQEADAALLKTRPTKLKAPQYFFGRQADNGDNAANWRPFAKLIFTATRKPAPAPAEPLPLEPAV